MKNTEMLIGLAENVKVMVPVDSGQTYDISYFCHPRGESYWELCVDKDTPSEYCWKIPDQVATVDDKGHCVVKDDKGCELMLIFSMLRPMLDADFDAMIVRGVMESVSSFISGVSSAG